MSQTTQPVTTPDNPSMEEVARAATLAMLSHPGTPDKWWVPAGRGQQLATAIRAGQVPGLPNDLFIVDCALRDSFRGPDAYVQVWVRRLATPTEEALGRARAAVTAGLGTCQVDEDTLQQLILSVAAELETAAQRNP